LDRAKEKGYIEMQKEEDRKTFSAIDFAATDAEGHNTVVTGSGGFGRYEASDLFLAIEQHNAPVMNMVMAPAQYRDLRNWGKEEVDPVDKIAAYKRDLVSKTQLFGETPTLHRRQEDNPDGRRKFLGRDCILGIFKRLKIMRQSDLHSNMQRQAETPCLSYTYFLAQTRL
jgi:plasmid stabilization system protein ParE